MALDNVYISEEMKVAYKKYCKDESEKKKRNLF